MIQNPILRGFNPDPSIIRVEDDYYIATSTFEWFPGVQIHHSKDLVNWELVSRPLNRLSQLDMRGNPDSCGVWAPCLSYKEGTFYLVYSNVRSFDGVWKDTPNYLVTTKDILGEWSEPIFLSSSGFDGSLFHHEDGSKWFTSMVVDQRKGKFFGGIILQEYKHGEKKLTGPIHHIFEGSDLGVTEAPHIYQKNEYFYLITAEGGTEYGHAVSLARSKNLIGPYELHPQNPLISAREHPSIPLQKCGHADLVEDKNGNWFAVFLVGRPLSERGRCTLGRETAIEEVEWRDDDWLYLKEGIDSPRLNIPFRYAINVQNAIDLSSHIDFQPGKLDIHFQSLRVPIEEDWLSLQKRPGYLRLFGRESLTSFHDQSLIARRVQHFHIEASTSLDFFPSYFQHLAGLVCYYNTAHWFYLHVLGDEDGRSRYLQILQCDNFDIKEVLEDSILLPQEGGIHLKAEINHADLQFYYGTAKDQWIPIGPTLDASILSDDYVRDGSDRYRPAFTGTFVGMCCQDLSGNKQYADFQFFKYKEIH